MKIFNSSNELWTEITATLADLMDSVTAGGALSSGDKAKMTAIVADASSNNYLKPRQRAQFAYLFSKYMYAAPGSASD